MATKSVVKRVARLHLTSNWEHFASFISDNFARKKTWELRQCHNMQYQCSMVSITRFHRVGTGSNPVYCSKAPIGVAYREDIGRRGAYLNDKQPNPQVKATSFKHHQKLDKVDESSPSVRRTWSRLERKPRGWQKCPGSTIQWGISPHCLSTKRRKGFRIRASGCCQRGHWVSRGAKVVRVHRETWFESRRSKVVKLLTKRLQVIRKTFNE